MVQGIQLYSIRKKWSYSFALPIFSRSYNHPFFPVKTNQENKCWVHIKLFKDKMPAMIDILQNKNWQRYR